jgi:hypothetical protein
MTDRERIRRPEPLRTAPIRNLSGLFRQPQHREGDGDGDGEPDDEDHAEARRAAFGDDPISRAVRAGFEVAEQAVRRGFESEPTSWPGSTLGWTPGAWADTVTGAATRWLETWSTILQSAVAATGAAARSAAPVRPAHGHAPDAPGPVDAVPAPSTGSALRVSVEVAARRPVAVQVDLTASRATAALTTHGLHAPPALGAPAITDVTLAIDDAGRVAVRIAVPDTQPAGAYVGAIVDERGSIAGTLSVRVAE